MIAQVSFALLWLSHLTSSHMIMKTPKPFSMSKFAIDNGPLDKYGSDYPCKFPYDPEGAVNEMALGSTQKLSFIGHAVHGGGSCQVSVAYEPEPNANTSFKVIHSIVGGCPSRSSPDNSLGPDEYDYKIPENLPAGNAIIAWTWFNKVGNREMYMDCAPVKLTGGPEKRDPEEKKMLAKRAEATLESLPNIMRANINNGCMAPEGYDIHFEEPGESVETNTIKRPGPFIGCCDGKCYGEAKAPITDPEKIPDCYPHCSGQDYAQQPTTSPQPGAFFTTPSADQSEDKKPQPSGSVDTSPNKPASQNPAPSDVTPTIPSAGTGNNSTASSDTKAGSPCSSEGLWNCVGGHSYQQCASGTWSVVMPMAAGTQCKEGQTTSFQVHKISTRSVRHPRSHLRRHQIGWN